ncbi:TBC1 domain family member 5 [Eurosta solidaginis]|uniref:TBC1 domain family member 5 n=1 Tax=Eurosta solidaginis TaxID=178769 RepID=UPI003530F7D3
MYVQGIEAIKQYMPVHNSQISANIKEERGQEVVPPTDTMSSAERYREEWQSLLKYLDEDPEHIREQAFQGDLKVSKFRSIYWSLLLRVLNTDYRSWKEQREKQRKRYEKLKDEFIKDPHDIQIPDDNPLSQSEESVWNQYFSDQELFAVISQDVVRTFPGVDFFRKKIIQNAMCNILFYYAREHPYMCYRQGMHEILAPILFVLYGDQQSLLHFLEISKHPSASDLLLNALDSNFLEADAYSIFSRLMSSIESYYRIKNFVKKAGDCGGVSVGDGADGDSKESSGHSVEIISQLNSIREKILAKEDLHLHNYLLKLDIPLHIFGIRWLRLLFGREFPLLDLLVIWDAIFADSDHFDLPNYILVAMLIRIRKKLLLSDQTTCLTYLMRYPTNVDVNLILRHALHMLMPKKFERPINAFVYFGVNNQSGVGSSNGALLKAEAKGTIQSGKFIDTAASSSIPQKNIAKMQTQNAAEHAAVTRLRKDRPEESSAIAEGYSKNSQELVHLELRNAQMIISIARNKLQTYAATIKNHIPRGGNGTKELIQALDGIDELCSFLDIKCMLPIHATRPPIDEALEANEQQIKARKDNVKINKNIAENVKLTTSSANLDSVINCKKSNGNATIVANSYMRPEDNVLTSPTCLLGSLREFELITIAPAECVVAPVDVSPLHIEYNNKQIDRTNSSNIATKISPNNQ